MKRTWKRIGSLFISVCMVLTMLPMTAFAETGDVDSGTVLMGAPTINIEDKETSMVQNEISAALSSATSGDTVTVNGTATITDTLNLTIPTEVTVDWKATVTGTSSGAMITIEAGSAGTFTVSDGMVQSTGSGYAIYNKSTGTITVSGGTVSSVTGHTIRNDSTGAVSMSGGMVQSTGAGSAIYNKSTGTITVSGGTVSSVNSYAINNKSTGTVTVSGATALITSAASDKATIFQAIDGGTATADRIVIQGGTVQNTDSGYAIHNQSTGGVSVSGGIVQSTGTGHAIYKENSGTVSVSGGIVQSTGSGCAIYNAHTGTVNVIGGTVQSTGTGHTIWNITTGTVNLSGGTVAANSGNAIYNHSTGSVRVSGGTIKGGISGASPTSNGTTPVHLTTLTGLPNSTAVTALDAPAGYGVSGIATDAAGKLYFYLPAGATNISLTANSSVYTVTGSVTDDNNTELAMTAETTPTYTATLNIQLDDEPSGVFFDALCDELTLKLSTDESQTVSMTGTGATWTATVQNGTWKLYVNGEDYGVTITVNNAPVSVTLDCITITTGIIPQGTATGGTIDTNGVTYSSLACLKGDTVAFTASGAGAASYTYAWTGTHNGNPINGTGNTYTINSVQGIVSIACTITGNGTTSPIEITGFTPILNVNVGEAGNASCANASVVMTILPWYASAVYSGAQTIDWDIVSWEDTDGYNPNKAGSYTFTATLSTSPAGYSNSSGHQVTVEVVVSPAGSGSGGGSSSGGGGGGSTPPASTPAPNPATGENPGQPVTASVTVAATAGSNGAASAAIPYNTITDAIAKAQADAKAQGKTENGISVGLNVTMPQGATSLTATLPQSSLNSLVSAGVSRLELNGTPVSLGLDLGALREIQRQSGGDISISIVPATGLSNEARALLGNRPVYNITISYVKDGKTTDVTSLGSGAATLAIPYTPGKNEAAAYLFGVYVDVNGSPQRIPGSAYDASSGCLLIPTGHFSVYGVGYADPIEKFTDIGTHWGKEAIGYVVGRGILSGTSETTFAPNTAMTRGMLVTALGRMESVDVKAYTGSSFSDVKADSAFGPYIEWAYKKGIIKGIGNQQYAPGRAITREEIAVIFTNYAKATGYTLPVIREATVYADSDRIGSIYKTAATAMQQAGIMTGGSGNQFHPKSKATRAEVSSMLHRYINLIGDSATAAGPVE